ncbi:hypothetical protein DRE_06641 [Drechslerella stenobrocha 248]|uniref:aminodeoxychorismate synthase n=1 Tax=Drechslerella stenobrocha 248 TaxID=1043628 RepID=W7I6S6_9PEZI|nr:hypothetical protein DRE_06641 [Drechslerella stenobrocha 248]
MAPTRRILLLDAYDSFSNNLAALIRHVTHAQVYTIKIDTYTFAEFRPFLKSFDAIVIGPGPGSPTNSQDVGIIPDVYALGEEDAIPVFGVCLGFQSLCLAFGARISRLNVVKHGQGSIIQHSGKDLFQDCGEVDAIRYHSLHAELSDDALQTLEILATADDGPEENGEVVMAVRHRKLPFWAVQYHPESCCTNPDGAKVVGNWWQMATSWLASRNRASVPIPADTWRLPLQQRSLLSRDDGGHGYEYMRPTLTVQYNTFHVPCLSIVALCEMLKARTQQEFAMLDSSARHTGRYTIIGVFSEQTETLTYRVGEDRIKLHRRSEDGYQGQDVLEGLLGKNVWTKVADYMESKRAEGGDIECPFWGGFIGYFNYEVGVDSLGVKIPGPRRDERPGVKWRPDVCLTFFERSLVVDNVEGKVWVQSIRKEDTAWVAGMSERVQLLAAMSVTPATTPLNGTPREGAAAAAAAAVGVVGPVFPQETVEVRRPDKERYMENVRRCQRELARGESYELCLTAQTTVDVQLPGTTADTNTTTTTGAAANGKQEDSAWRIYRHLRTKNPAPFAGLYKVLGTTLLSSSPERFLSWDRAGKVQLRPIKGTVRKARPNGGTVSRREAEAVLNTPKERAENLMIVDLIRHDLHGVVDVDDGYKHDYHHTPPVDAAVPADINAEATHPEVDTKVDAEVGGAGVSVTKLMGIEEYETVFQLVSVIEGRLSRGMRLRDGFSGLDVLQRCLPPGSMTGAPKKRSVEILQQIEADAVAGAQDECGERGVYSGVLGYYSVCGAGDWSVIIRSMYRFDGEGADDGVERWRIGAGGAVTALSDAEGEWDEMVVKLDSTLAALQ